MAGGTRLELLLWVLLATALGGCAGGGGGSDYRSINTMNVPAPADAMAMATMPGDIGMAGDPMIGDGAAGDGAGVLPTGNVAWDPQGCDMNGAWVAQQVTVSVALNTNQVATNWFYFVIEQSSEDFTVVESLHCGFIVQGTTDVTISDSAIQAIAERNSSNGRRGSYSPDGSGSCFFFLERTYNVFGASVPHYLLNLDDPLRSEVGDPGMEDWDLDNKPGITLFTGAGERYVALREWNEYIGTTPLGVDRFSAAVEWNSEEVVHNDTPFVLRVSSEHNDNVKHDVELKRLAQPLDLSVGELASCQRVRELAQAP